jgi:hypothetical protein
VIEFAGSSCCSLEVEGNELGKFEVQVIDGSSVVKVIHLAVRSQGF